MNSPDRTTTVTICDENMEAGDVILTFKMNNNILYVNGGAIGITIPPNPSDEYDIYTLYLPFGGRIASILSNFNPEDYGDIAWNCSEQEEVYLFFDTLIIMLIRGESVSPNYIVKDCVLYINSTKKTHTLGEQEEEPSPMEYYNIIRDLHH